MPTVTTSVLRKYDEAHDGSRAGLCATTLCGTSPWWFCKDGIERLWHIPKTATLFEIKFSTRQLAGSYKLQLARRACRCGPVNPWQFAFRLIDESRWRRLNESTGIEFLFTQFRITDEPKTVWVQLLYE